MKLWKWSSTSLVVLAFAMTVPAAAQETIKLRFGKLGPNLGMARAEIAESQGFFKKHKLDVEVTQFRASPELLTAAVSGAVDVGIAGLPLVLTGRQRSLPLKAFYVETSAPFYHLLSSTDITSLQDAIAKGATVGVSGIGSLDYTVTRYIFKRAGLDPEKLKFVQAGTPGQRTAALEAGRVQLALSAIPEKYAVIRRGKVKEIASMGQFSKNFSLEIFWAREDFIAANAEVIRRFLAAMDDTAMWIRTSPQAAEALAKFIGMNYPEAADDVKEALKGVHYPTVAEHKARLAELLEGAEPLAQDALDRKILQADNAKALVQQVFDLRYVK